MFVVSLFEWVLPREATAKVALRGLLFNFSTKEAAVAWFLAYKMKIEGGHFSGRYPLNVDSDYCHEVVRKAKLVWQMIIENAPESKFFDPEIVCPISPVVENKSETGASAGKRDPVHNPDPTAEQ
ncbi:MAG: hypothetical protein AAB697_01870 [Patescibacteria group bacterium]